MGIVTGFNQIQGAPNRSCQPYSSSFVYLWLSAFGSGPTIPAQHPTSNQIIMKLSNSQQEPAARRSTSGISAIGGTCGYTGMWATQTMSLQRSPKSSHQHLLTFLRSEENKWMSGTVCWDVACTQHHGVVLCNFTDLKDKPFSHMHCTPEFV